jgi:AhpC/TSA antioxidant enzyme
MLCRQQVAQVCAHADRIAELCAGLLFVGSGTPPMASDFQAAFCPDASVAIDPERRAFDAFDLKRGVMATLGLRAMIAGTAALLRGHRQGGMRGDAWQQGGAFVIDTEGHIRFAHVDRRSGDHVKPQDLLDAVQSLRT